MKASIIVFPGTNREPDMAAALERVTGKAPAMVWHKDTDIGHPDLIVLPGGFSYGDYLRCGAMAAHSPVMGEVIALAKKGTRVLGVCNGFQMLVETHLLPGALLRNNGLQFICKHVNLRCENADTDFTRRMKQGEVIRIPIAHGEGNYFADDKTLDEMEANGQVAFRYCNDNGEVTVVANPNGAARNIAGVFNEKKTILGMMPHPENAVMDWQDSLTGLKLFEGIVDSLS